MLQHEEYPTLLNRFVSQSPNEVHQNANPLPFELGVGNDKTLPLDDEPPDFQKGDLGEPLSALPSAAVDIHSVAITLDHLTERQAAKHKTAAALSNSDSRHGCFHGSHCFYCKHPWSSGAGCPVCAAWLVVQIRAECERGRRDC
jgi:hypothetical protein